MLYRQHMHEGSNWTVYLEYLSDLSFKLSFEESRKFELCPSSDNKMSAN